MNNPTSSPILYLSDGPCSHCGRHADIVFQRQSGLICLDCDQPEITALHSALSLLREMHSLCLSGQIQQAARTSWELMQTYGDLPAHQRRIITQEAAHMWTVVERGGRPGPLDLSELEVEA